MNKKALKQLQWYLEKLFQSEHSEDWHKFEDSGMDIISRKDEFRPALIELLGEPEDPREPPLIYNKVSSSPAIPVLLRKTADGWEII